MDNSLNDKVALIFGASSGIGRQIAEKLLDKGAKVYNASRSENLNSKIISVYCDVSKSSSVENAVAGVGTACDGIDYLIYSAGFSMASPIEHVNDDDFRYLFEVNFFGALRAVKTAIPFLKKRTGRILLISSIGAILPIPFDAFYSCSKASIDMLAKSINVELRPCGIKATALRPGGTKTDFSYKRKVYLDSAIGDYAKRQNEAVKKLCHIEQSGMSAESVALSGVKILLSQNPPVICSAGFINKSLSLTDKLLPVKLTNYVNASQYFS